jgi:hypothetical protein
MRDTLMPNHYVWSKPVSEVDGADLVCRTVPVSRLTWKIVTKAYVLCIKLNLEFWAVLGNVLKLRVKTSALLQPMRVGIFMFVAIDSYKCEWAETLANQDQ